MKTRWLGDKSKADQQDSAETGSKERNFLLKAENGKTKYFFIIPLVLFLLVYLLPLNLRPLFLPDETRYAEIPREMIETGDWVVPRANGLRYFEKPVMGYWLTAASLLILGENNFAVRFPSALSAGLTALLLALLCRRCLGPNTRASWMAPLVYITTLGVAVIGTFAVLDSVLTFFLTATLVPFFLATEENRGSPLERSLLLAAGVSAGCAFLTKGFLAFAVPVLTAAPYIVLQGRYKEFFRFILVPLLGTMIVVLPWSILIHWREPDFWHYFFWTEHVQRFLARSAQHKEPIWFYGAVLPAMLVPWIFLAPAAFTGFRQIKALTSPEKKLIQFVCCWALMPLLFFSISNGKLPTYILPCIPPLAILISIGLLNNNNKKSENLTRYGILIFAVIMAALIVYTLYSRISDTGIISDYSKQKFVTLLTMLMSIITVLCMTFYVKFDNKIALYSLAISIFLFFSNLLIPPITLNKKTLLFLKDNNIVNMVKTTNILADEKVVLGLCWHLKRKDISIIGFAGELEYGLGYPDAATTRVFPAEAGNFIKDHLNSLIVISSDKHYAQWQPLLPDPLATERSQGKNFVLARY